MEPQLSEPVSGQKSLGAFGSAIPAKLHRYLQRYSLVQGEAQENGAQQWIGYHLYYMCVCVNEEVKCQTTHLATLGWS